MSTPCCAWRSRNTVRQIPVILLSRALSNGDAIRRDLIHVAARTARRGRGRLTLHLPESWYRSAAGALSAPLRAAGQSSAAGPRRRTAGVAPPGRSPAAARSNCWACTTGATRPADHMNIGSPPDQAPLSCTTSASRFAKAGWRADPRSAGWAGRWLPGHCGACHVPCSATEPAHSRPARFGGEWSGGNFGLTADAGGTRGPGSGHYLLCPGTHQGIVRDNREHGSGNDGCGGNGISENDGSCVG